jgi:hypothetical protein
MKFKTYSASALAIAATVFLCQPSVAQIHNDTSSLFASNSSSSSSVLDMTTTSESAAGVVRPVPATPAKQHNRVPFAVAAHLGINGVGFDVAAPLAPKLNVRAGMDMFSYSFGFQEEGADINAAFRLRSGHAAVDWFPFRGKFRISPLVQFANNNQVRATALIPAGSSLSLNGQDYISSYTDPLHGSGTVGFRKVSPGLSLGFGNMIPRTRSRVSFPVEAGFYYVGQPSLKVDFSGSACDPQYPASVGCQPVMQDPGFQKDLASFIARNNHNLSYASFFPIFSVGFSYSIGGRQGRVE